MAAASWLLGALLSAGLSMFVSAGQQKITAQHGDNNVVLPCRLTSRNPVIVVEWTRTSQGSEYVLVYRDEQIDPFNQHPSFMNRVDLQDRTMKDGDVSLVLKNVRTEDSGTYECRVVQSGTNRRKNLISTIYLEVASPPPGHFEKQIGDREVQAGSEEEHGESQEILTSRPPAAGEAEVTKNEEKDVREAQEDHAQALKVVGDAPIQKPGDKNREGRMIPGLIASLTCSAAAVVAGVSLTIWKKRSSPVPPDKVQSAMI